MTISKDLLNPLLSNPSSIKTWALEIDNPKVKITTDGTDLDNLRAVEVVKLMLNKGNNPLEEIIDDTHLS